MSSILVTIEGPDRSLDLAVPASMTASQIIEAVAPHLMLAGSTVWLALTSGRRLAPTESLDQAAVLDGTVLRIENDAVGGETPPVRTTVREAPEEVSTRVIPDPVPRSRRMETVLRAALGLTRPPGALGVMARAAAAWEWTDHMHRIRWLTARPRLERSPTVVVSGHRSDEVVELVGAELAAARPERPVIVDLDPRSTLIRRASRPGAAIDEIESALRRRTRSALEIDAMFARTTTGLALAGNDPTGPDADPATVRRLIGALAMHAGIVIVHAGESASALLVELADQLVVSTAGGPVRPAKQTIVADWADGDPTGAAEVHARVPFHATTRSAAELGLLVAAGWAPLGIGTPVPRGM